MVQVRCSGAEARLHDMLDVERVEAAGREVGGHLVSVGAGGWDWWLALGLGGSSLEAVAGS